MDDVPLAEAKARLSELVERARQGQPVRITRRGKPVARLVAAETPRRPIDPAELEALTSGMQLQPESAGEWLSRLRKSSRY